MLETFSVDLSNIEQQDYDQDEKVENERKCLCSSCEYIERNRYEQRKIACLKLFHLFNYFDESCIILFNIGGVHRSMIKLVLTLIIILFFLVTFFVSLLSGCFIFTCINHFFDEADGNHNEVQQDKQKCNEDDTSLTILSDSVSHLSKVNSNLFIINSNYFLSFINLNQQTSTLPSLDYIGRYMQAQQTPKSNNNIKINKKESLSQDKKTNRAKTQTIFEKVNPPKTPQKPFGSPDKKRYMMQLNGIKYGDLAGEIKQKENELSAKSQKMCACINLFNLMQSNNMHLRCVHHNNILTLYCLTQRKVLCVNCNYGDFKHKTHKILPLKDSSQYINQDNFLLKDMLHQDLRGIDQSIKNCQQNANVLENQLKTHLKIIQRQFLKKIEDLKSKYKEQTQRLIKTFSTVIDKINKLEKNIEQFKFNIWNAISKVGTGKKSNESLNNQSQIVKQVFCSSMAEITKYYMRKFAKKDVDKLLHKSKFGSPL